MTDATNTCPKCALRARVAPEDQLLTPAETAALLRIDSKSLTRWVEEGWIGCITLPSSHRRYREAEVRAIAGNYTPPKLVTK